MKNLNSNTKKLIMIIISVCLVGIWNPLGLSLNQVALTSALLFAIACWATDAIHKTLACGIFLVSTWLFGNTPMTQIFSFVWSDTNLLIMTTTLLSVALLKSHVIYRAVATVFEKSANKPLALLVLPYVLGVILVFIIPQAFARVIIVGTILDGLLQANTPEQQQAKSALIFNAFIGISIAYMLFSNGDIVLNLSALKFAGEDIAQQLQFQQWFIMMSVPVVTTAIVTIIVTKVLFKKELQHLSLDMMGNTEQVSRGLTKQQDYLNLSLMGVVLIFWMSAGIHHIQPWIVALVAIVVLLVGKVLTLSDFKAINSHFIIFLMTVFNIGKILGQSGVTEIIFNHLKEWIPSQQSVFFLLIIILVTMALHLCIGSSVATMSVVFPIILPLMQSLHYSGSVIVLMIYVIVNIHFLLPFHHAVMLMGTGKKYYPEKSILRFGTVMTVLTPLLILLVYFGWWTLLNLYH